MEANASLLVSKGKEKCSRKRKKTALEAEAGLLVLRGKVARKSEIKVAIGREVP